MHATALLVTAALLTVAAAALTPPVPSAAPPTTLTSATFTLTLPTPLPPAFSVRYTTTSPTAPLPNTVVLHFVPDPSWSSGASEQWTLSGLPTNTSFSASFTSYDAVPGAPRNASSPSPPVAFTTAAPAGLACSSLFDLASTSAFPLRFRGSIYTIGSAESILVDFGMHLDAPQGTVLHFAVFEKPSGASSYTQLFVAERTVGAGEGPFKYHSGSGPPSLSLALQAHASYAIGVYWQSSVGYYFSSVAPPTTSFCFGTLDSGTGMAISSTAAGVDPSLITPTASYYATDVVVAAADTLPSSPSLAALPPSDPRPDSAALSAAPIAFSSPSLAYHAYVALRPVSPASVFTRIDFGPSPNVLVRIFDLVPSTNYSAFQSVSASNDATALAPALDFATPPLPTSPPSAPPTLTLAVVGTSLQLSWTVADNYPTSHTVRYRVSGSAAPYTSVSLGLDTTYVIDFLASDTSYDVAVSAANAIGASSFSPTLVGTIPPILCTDTIDFTLPDTPMSTTSVSSYFANIYTPTRPLAVAEIRVYAVYTGLYTFRFLVRALPLSADPTIFGFPHLAAGTTPPEVLLDHSVVIDATVSDSPTYKSSGPVQALLSPGRMYHIAVIPSSSVTTQYAYNCDSDACTSAPTAAGVRCLNHIAAVSATSSISAPATTVATTSLSVENARYSISVVALALTDTPPRSLALAPNTTPLPASAALTWLAPVSGPPPSGYVILHSTTAAAGPFVPLATLPPASATAATASGLTPNALQWLAVANAADHSLVSNVIAVTTPPLPTATPLPVSAISASYSPAGSLDVAFAPSPSVVDKYTLLMRYSTQTLASRLPIGQRTAVNITQPFHIGPATLILAVEATNALGSTVSTELSVALPTPPSPPGPPPSPGPADTTSTMLEFTDITSCPVGWSLSYSTTRTMYNAFGMVYYAHETSTLDRVGIALSSGDITTYYGVRVTVSSSPSNAFGAFSTAIATRSLTFVPVANVFGPSSSYDGVMPTSSLNIELTAGNYYLIDVQFSGSVRVRFTDTLLTKPLRTIAPSCGDALVPVAAYRRTAAPSSPPPPPFGSRPPPPPPAASPPPLFDDRFSSYSAASTHAFAAFIVRGSDESFAMPPRDVAVAIRYPTTADLTWREPLFSAPASFVVEHRPSGSSDPWVTATLDATAARVAAPTAPCFADAIVPLDSSTATTRHFEGGCWSPLAGSSDENYYFYVAVAHSSSSSSWYVNLDSVKLTSGSYAPESESAPPTHCSSTDPDSYWFRWGPYYITPGVHTVQFFVTDPSPVYQLTVAAPPAEGPARFSARLTGLTPGSSYDVRISSVVPQAAASTSAYADIDNNGVFATAAAPTSVPTLALSRPLFSGVTANFSWSLGTERSTFYVDYIRIRLTDGHSHNITVDVDREACAASVASLREFTHYSYAVTAHNIAGASSVDSGSFRTGASFSESQRPSFMSKTGVILMAVFLTLLSLAIWFGVKAAYDRAVWPDDYAPVVVPPPPVPEGVMMDPFNATPASLANLNNLSSSDDNDDAYTFGGSLPPPPPKLPTSAANDALPIYGGGDAPPLPSYGEALVLKH